MKKFFVCISLVLTGLMTSCIDKNEEVDADSRPSWLGESIYAELKNPESHGLLTGTFQNYLRLIDDLGYDEVLSRTGSKTVFPANDDAFNRFFASNDWGVRSYRQLTFVQKKLLLYSSMLDNALLLSMLPNVSNNTNEPDKGEALRHPTNVSIIDSVQFVRGSGSSTIRPEGMPANNPYWKKYYDKGIYTVSDATRPMMVHLTREYMLNNGISTLGDDSDFAILTGSPYAQGNAYVFNVGVMKNPSTGKYIGDVTCQNGYIHQMADVIVPPGNMGQVLRKKSNTKLFSRIVDYFAVPFYDATTTKNYHDWYNEQVKAGNDMSGVSNPDSIFQVRYMSLRSAPDSKGSNALITDPNKQTLQSTQVLNFDLGWNHYFPKPAKTTTGIDYEIMDMGALFVPSDEAVKHYFLPGGEGAYLIDIYGDRENTEANLEENLDSIYTRNAQVLTAFANNLMKPSFAATVPSKFESVNNDASENMGLKIDLLEKTTDGKYDITIANNGVIYVLKELIAPDEYQAVLAPASTYPDMSVMNWCVQDGVKSGDYLGVDFKYYLLAMSANYAFFIPDDAAFDLYYLDPASLGHLFNNTVGTQRPDVLHFYYNKAATSQPYLACDRHYFDLETGEIDPTPRKVGNIKEVASQLVDILNYHTLVLNSGETIGKNKFYKTKHGGEVYVPDGHVEGGRVMSGLQIEKPDLFPAPKITNIYKEKNGYAYRMDHVIQSPINSVYSILKDNKQFSEFLQACWGFSAEKYLEWAGIKKVNPTDEKLPSPQAAYTVFTKDYSIKGIEDACLDYNVKMFNTYNYTLFAPDNDAMNAAYADGLPRWSDIEALFNKYHPEDEGDEEEEEAGEDEEVVSPAEQADKDRAKLMIDALRDFVRYHFVTNSVYADNVITTGRYQTMSSDDMGVAREVVITGGDGVINVADQKSGHTVKVNATDAPSKVVNKMARDYWFNAKKTVATGIETSSFCAVHQISSPLYYQPSGRYDGAWASRSAFDQQKKAKK